MAFQHYTGGLNKIVMSLSAALLSVSTLVLGGVGVSEYIVPIFNQPTSFSDFESLDKDGTTIACDSLDKQFRNSNIALDEQTNNYNLKQCQLVVKKNIATHCDNYAQNVFARISSEDNVNIDLSQGNKDVCAAPLDKKLGNYNEAYDITQKDGEKFVYIKKYNAIILGSKIGPDTVEIIQSKLDNSLWYVQFTAEDKNDDSGYSRRFLYFTDKDKATNFYTAMKNIHNADGEAFGNLLSNSLKKATQK